MKQDKDNAEFDEYRRKMHREDEEESGRPVVPAPKRPVAIAFGIFMILVYVGVGVLLIINVFRWEPSWDWARWVVGFLLIIYGIFRGYRMFVGNDYYGK
ncbi:MAG: hypothetical protein LIP09_01275 [Bacteroidales bacterium]|nr:hypothetical protein [Bacteroidales bacterium]